MEIEHLRVATRTNFDASTILTVSQAADQDGYDGGYVARTPELEAWGETPEEAKQNLVKLQATQTNP